MTNDERLAAMAAGRRGLPLLGRWQRFIDKPRPMLAIRMFCYDCQGGVLSEVRRCNSVDCPLWLFRRGRKSADAESRSKWQIASKVRYIG